MRIETVTVGLFQAHAHVLIDEATGACAIVDTGESGLGIAEAVASAGARPEVVLLTHGHLDHAGGLAEVRRRFPGVPIRAHRGDRELIETMPLQGRMFGVEIEAPPALDGFVEAGEQIEIGSGVRLTVLATPGHSPGSVSYYEPHAGVAIVGDTLFAGGIGRTDLPGGSARQLLASIREQLLTLPPETRCYAGHGPATTIGAERRSNPFLQPGAERLMGLA